MIHSTNSCKQRKTEYLHSALQELCFTSDLSTEDIRMITHGSRRLFLSSNSLPSDYATPKISSELQELVKVKAIVKGVHLIFFFDSSMHFQKYGAGKRPEQNGVQD